MAKNSPLLDALLGAEKTAKAVKNAKTLAPPAVTAAPAPEQYKPPTKAQRLKDDAEYAKQSATRRWVEGSISTQEHNKVHGRANQVLRDPHRFIKPAAGKGARMGKGRC